MYEKRDRRVLNNNITSTTTTNSTYYYFFLPPLPEPFPFNFCFFPSLFSISCSPCIFLAANPTSTPWIVFFIFSRLMSFSANAFSCAFVLWSVLLANDRRLPLALIFSSPGIGALNLPTLAVDVATLYCTSLTNCLLFKLFGDRPGRNLLFYCCYYYYYYYYYYSQSLTSTWPATPPRLSLLPVLLNSVFLHLVLLNSRFLILPFFQKRILRLARST